MWALCWLLGLVGLGLGFGVLFCLGWIFTRFVQGNWDAPDEDDPSRILLGFFVAAIGLLLGLFFGPMAYMIGCGLAHLLHAL